MGVEFIDNRAKVKSSVENAGISWLYEACGEIEAQTKGIQRWFRAKPREAISTWWMRMPEKDMWDPVMKMRYGRNLARESTLWAAMGEKTAGGSK